MEKVLQNISGNYEKMDNTSLHYLLLCMAKIRVKTSSKSVRTFIVNLLNKMKASRTNLFLRIRRSRFWSSRA